MMSDYYWLTLPESWDIGNVRATLAFLISFFCAGGVWVFAYAAWKHGAIQASRASQAKVMSLLSLGGLGEVFDVIPLLRLDMGIGLLSWTII